MKKKPHSIQSTPRVLAGAIALMFSQAYAAETQSPKDQLSALQSVSIIDVAPLPGIELDRNQVAGNVQQLNQDELQSPLSTNFNEVLNKRLGSVHINEIQNNPYQPDVNYRGFTASPLLGTPQGLSVYLDGVRMNQPFGDVVSWDLIPRSALSSLTLIPGSNPVFGLNTLGGALVLKTKDGRSNPGTSVQGLVGNYGRAAVEFEHGGSNAAGWDWFVTANRFSDNGWRTDSPTDVTQLFSKLGWRDSKTLLSASLSMADNQLTGNGLQEASLLARDYSSVYTKPDETDNKSWFLNLQGSRSLNDTLTLTGNTYYRKIKTRTLNGDINEGSLDQNTYLTGTGATGNANRTWLTNNGFAGQFPLTAENAANTPFPKWACIAQAGQNDEPGEKCNGLLNRSQTDQENYGGGLQLSSNAPLWGYKNQFTVGAALDYSSARYNQTTQLGYLNPDRSVTGLNSFADGRTGGDVDGAPFDNRVILKGHTDTWSVYGSDTMTFQDVWHLTVSGRLNNTTVKNRDQLTPGGGAGSLDGNHEFSRFNPAVGLTYAPRQSYTAYVSYNEGSRAPSAIELGCADPANPCKLPNALASDPALKQVVTKTQEAGIHGLINPSLGYKATVFRADNVDDLLFVATTAGGAGYFKNFGKTRRQGVELGMNAQVSSVAIGVNYTYLDATYESPESVLGLSNSTRTPRTGEEGVIRIRPGDQIPLVPKHIFKTYADWGVTNQWTVGMGMTAIASSFARGNENNQHQASGAEFIGTGKNSGYALFDLGTQYKVDKQLKVFAQINNLFDRQYSSAAQLGPTGFTANGNFVSRPLPQAADGSFPVVHSTFFAPGAPRTAWVGVRYSFN